MKSHIAAAEWSNGYKENLVNAYNHYAARASDYYGELKEKRGRGDENYISTRVMIDLFKRH